jgi:hypothetical protein
MDRLSALDNEFLLLEDDHVQMHIAGACVFDGRLPGLDELRDLVHAKLHLIPRYRQRIQRVPFDLGRPVWVDDPHFDLSHHLHRAALPSPGGRAEFCSLMGELMSDRLDRDRPLWRAWLVEGMEDGRWAIIFQVHHAMVDGIAGVALLSALLDLTPADELPLPPPWEPSPLPGATALIGDAWSGLAGDLVGWGRGVPHAALHPVRTIRWAFGEAQGGMRVVRHLTPTPAASVEGSIGSERVWAYADIALDDVATVRHAFGGTVNDVVVTAVAEGYRALLLSRGEDPDHLVVRSLLPVSTRGADSRGVPDNRVSGLLYELPVAGDDPVARLHRVHRELVDLKAGHTAEAAATVAALSDLVLPAAISVGTRMAMRSAHRLGQPVLSTVTTNVPGPQVPLWCLGRQMLEYRPYVPITHGVRIGTAVLSYNGRLFVGCTGDAGTAPDVDVLAAAISTSVDALVALVDDGGIDHGGVDHGDPRACIAG